VSGNHNLRVKQHFACGNRTLRVEINLVRVKITLVRVEITLVRVGITFMPVEITLRVEITLYMFLHRNHTRECHIHTHTYQTYTRVCVKSHYASGNCTLRVENYPCVYKSHSSVS
jgi:hypothetical protein